MGGPKVNRVRMTNRRKGLRLANLAVLESGAKGVCSTHGVDLRICLGEQAPLLRGCPDRGGERQAKGRAHSLRSNAWGEARAAHFAFRAR